MKIPSSIRKSKRTAFRAMHCVLTIAAATGFSGVASAQTYYSPYIPTATATATSTLYTAGSTTIATGRVSADKLGNVFYVAKSGASGGTLYEIPASANIVTVTAPTPLVSGLGSSANSAFVDPSGTLWVANAGGSGPSLLEIPAANGVPNVASVTSASGYGSTGLALSSITAACSSTSTAACGWTASSIGSTFSSLQIADIYSDGAGNLTLVDVSDSTSNGSYNRVLQFKTSTVGTMTVIADNLTANAFAQVTIAGDGNVYYCDSTAGNASGGLVSVIKSGTLTTVGNTNTANLTLQNANVKVTAASGVTSDPWGDLIISGPIQISEVPLELGVLTFPDEFNLLLGASGSNSPVYSNHIVYGGTIDVHGNYYYATASNVMLTEIGGHNFGKVNVGTEVTTGVPFLNITWGLPSQLNTSLVSTSSPNTLSAANAAYLQSFPFSGQKSYFGGTPFSAASPGSYSQMFFQPVNPGLLRGSISPQGNSNYANSQDSSPTADLYNEPAYVANLQGVGIGPRPMFVPGTASQAVTVSQLYTSYSHTAKAVAFTPSSVGVDTFGDIFVTDTANTSLDLDCLSTTANTAQIYRAAAAGASSGPGYTNSYCLTDGLQDTNKTNLTGYTFKVSATGAKPTVTYPTNFTTPVDVVLDGANNAFVLDSGNNVPTLTIMDFATMIPHTVIPAQTKVAGLPFSNPQGLAMDGYANLYISDTGNNRIVQAHYYNASYAQTALYVPATTSFGGSGLNSPMGIGLDSAGDLFIADTGNKRIVEYSATGVPSVVTSTGTALVNPTSVKVLPSGALVVADSSLGLVLIDGGVASVLSTGSITLQSTQGLAVDLMGNIYVSDPVGGQVVELNLNSPANASFPDTLKPDSSGSHTSKETSYIYNDGNATLNITAPPTVIDNTSATSEFAVDGNNACTTGTSLAPNANCGLAMDFTPSSTAVVYTTVTGTATVTDNFPVITLKTNPASGAQDIGVFTTPGTQQVILSGNPVVPFTAQSITFPTPTPVTWNGSNQSVTLNAIGGPSGSPVVYSIVSGPGTLSTVGGVTTVTVKDIGTTVVAANQKGALNNGVYYSNAPQVTANVVVNPIGTVATPTFSVPGGTYTAVQNVTISDATAGATIYYTTNGNTPTVSSPVYTPGTVINITVTTTVKAIAVGAPGYANSAVATAVYTLPPDFTMKLSRTSFDIPNGLGGSTTLTFTPLFGFSGDITLSCSGLPAGDTCAFLDGSVNAQLIPNGTYTIRPTDTVIYGTFIIQTNEKTAALRSRDLNPFGAPAVVLASAVFVGFFRRRKELVTLALLVLTAAGATMLSGCSENLNPLANGKTNTHTFTLTATSGSIVHTQTITLNVNNE